ncbi:hypothetical protein [uncultured Hydrogenophaga sp.]|uniref:hypothetical protein n=1 Tax=uncultured Hydrogenophaga sp. TaxID=199683 RepID=UPI0026604A5E|nr:hypothetical protein [uncultured Hydrogenophaga sp.]
MGISHGATRAIGLAHPAPQPLTHPHPGTPPRPPRPDVGLLRQARAVVTVHQKRAFLDKLARQSMASLTGLHAPGTTHAGSGIWDNARRPQWLVQGITSRLIQADTRGQLFTNSSGRGDPVKQLIFWEEAPGHPQRVTVHTACIDESHPVDITENALEHIRAQGYREAEVRVDADQPAVADRFRNRPGWHATGLEAGDTLFRRDLGPALPDR